MDAAQPAASDQPDKTSPPTQQDAGPSGKSAEPPKRHAACDECRKRKLKCTGEPDGCRRCARHRILCHYSFQKQMGRPPKTPKHPHAAGTKPELRSILALSELDSGYSAPDAAGTLEASLMCPAVYKSYMRNTYDVRPGPFMTDGPLSGQAETRHQHPPTSPPRDVDYFQITPFLSQSLTSLESSANTRSTSNTSPVPSAFPQTGGPCACLSHLYLSLSSLSSLNSFPLSSNTLSTLYNATKIAQGVLRCEVCPLEYSSAVQNLMLLGTLLPCIANSWLAISAKDGAALGEDMLGSSLVDTLPTNDEFRKTFWKDWLRQIVRYAVIGSTTSPNVPLVQRQCEETPNLLSLIEAMEQRQLLWHTLRMPLVNPSCSQDNHAQNLSPLGLKEPDFLCVRIAGNARTIIDQFAFDAEDFLNRE